MNRRDFFRTAFAGITAATVAPSATAAEAFVREKPTLPPEALGLLYDSTLCIGCKACVKACKEANDCPPEIDEKQVEWNRHMYDSPKDLSAKTLNIIKVYQHGTAEKKDAAENGFAFVKRQCMHCVDPSCVSACPVSAMTKDDKTGLVSHDPDRCIGCRYCVLSCPFAVPKYDYNDPFGKIHKCQLCKHRLEKDQLPACADVCPTGATLFGKTEDLKREAQSRLNQKPGELYTFQRGDIAGQYGGQRPSHDAPIAAYQPSYYGENQVGGTQCLVLAGVPYEKLGYPDPVPDYGYPTRSEGIQHTLYHGMVAPVALLAGLTYLAKRHRAGDEDKEKSR